jgi:CubicO group peptidase (beta-lactamase class C family)
MAAIVLRADTVLARGIAGVRHAGAPGAVTIQDRFQLGSNTKAITATLLATFVQGGTLSWTTTLADVFREQSASMSVAFRGVTLEQLLSHHAGVSPFTDTDDRTPRVFLDSLALRRSGAVRLPRGCCGVHRFNLPERKPSTQMVVTR